MVAEKVSTQVSWSECCYSNSFSTSNGIFFSPPSVLAVSVRMKEMQDKAVEENGFGLHYSASLVRKNRWCWQKLAHKRLGPPPPLFWITYPACPSSEMTSVHVHQHLLTLSEPGFFVLQNPGGGGGGGAHCAPSKNRVTLLKIHSSKVFLKACPKINLLTQL